MDLNKAVESFQKLQERIKGHHYLLRRNEAQTRVSLIDPVLRLLGWEVGDPEHVEVEVRTGESIREKADYVLKSPKSRIAVIEAKPLGTNFGPTERRQVKEYADFLNVELCALTDGAQWNVYDLRKAGRNPEEMQPSYRFDVVAEEAAVLALKCLVLWRPNLTMESGPIEASEPKIVPLTGRVVEVQINESVATLDPAISSTITRETDVDSRWVSLRSVDVNSVESAPSQIRFEDGGQLEIKYAYMVLVEVAEWLGVRGFLKGPLSLREWSKRYHVNEQPEYEPGVSFQRSKRLSNGFYVDTNVSLRDSLRMSVNALEQCGRDPSQVYVRFE